MSLLEHKTGPARAAALVLLCIGLGGCLRPLYAELPTGGTVKTTLAAIDVLPIVDRAGQERIGHFLQNELVFDLDGSGKAPDKRYKLQVTVNERLSSTVVDTETGRANSAILVGEAEFVLKPLGDGPSITTGKAVASASYDRSAQRFGAARAARDAEIRVARALSEQIRTRLAATLSGRS